MAEAGQLLCLSDEVAILEDWCSCDEGSCGSGLFLTFLEEMRMVRSLAGLSRALLWQRFFFGFD